MAFRTGTRPFKYSVGYKRQKLEYELLVGKTYTVVVSVGAVVVTNAVEISRRVSVPPGPTSVAVCVTVRSAYVVTVGPGL